MDPYRTSTVRLVSAVAPRDQRPSLAELQLVASDYDGTLLGADREISATTSGVLAELADTHVEIVVITGRPPRYCHNILAQIGVEATLICANGALGYDPVTNEITQYANLDLAVAHQIIGDVLTEHPDAGFSAEMGSSFVAERRWYTAAGRPVEGEILDLRHHLDERIHKLLVSLPGRTPDEALRHITQITGSRANPMHAGLPFIELMPPGVDKAFGLERHCADRNIDRRAVLSFGDMPNDVAMLAWAGWGVAVGNAHEMAKAAADEVTKTNVDDGVAHVLAGLLSH